MRERKEVLVGAPKLNEWTGVPFSPRYYEILEKRKELPAWQASNEIVELVSAYQVVIL